MLTRIERSRELPVAGEGVEVARPRKIQKAANEKNEAALRSLIGLKPLDGLP